MNYKIAIILNNFAPQDIPLLYGVLAYQLNFILNLSKNFIIDIYCTNTSQKTWEGINNISLINPNAPLDKNFFEAKDYNVVLDFLNNNYKSEKFITIALKHNYNDKQSTNPMDVDILFVSSEQLKNTYLKNTKIKEQNIKILHPCLSSYKPFLPKQQNKSFSSFGIDFRHLKLFQKIQLLLAFIKLKKEKYLFSLKIIAPHHKKNIFLNLLSLIFLTKEVEFLNFQEKMDNFWDKLDYFINLKQSPFNFSTIEAMNNSIPCITTDLDGASSIISNNQSGWIIDTPLTTKKLFEALKTILDNNKNYQEIAKNANQIASKLTIEEHSKKLFDIIEEKILSNNQDCENNP